jgi:hypothetical protein
MPPLAVLTAKTVPIAHAASSTRLSGGAIVAATLAALLIVTCLAWAAARWWAYEPHWPAGA